LKVPQSAFGAAFLVLGLAVLVSLVAFGTPVASSIGELVAGVLVSVILFVAGLTLLLGSRGRGGVARARKPTPLSEGMRGETEGTDSKAVGSALDLMVLDCLDGRKSLEEIAQLTKVEPRLVGQRIAKLQLEGFVGPDGHLTQKGSAAIRRR
jgi:hypothetical protein